MQNLPLEIKFKILEQLHLYDIINMRLVSKEFNTIIISFKKLWANYKYVASEPSKVNYWIDMGVTNFRLVSFYSNIKYSNIVVLEVNYITPIQKIFFLKLQFLKAIEVKNIEAPNLTTLSLIRLNKCNYFRSVKYLRIYYYKNYCCNLFPSLEKLECCVCNDYSITRYNQFYAINTKMPEAFNEYYTKIKYNNIIGYVSNYRSIITNNKFGKIYTNVLIINSNITLEIAKLLLSVKIIELIELKMLSKVVLELPHATKIVINYNNMQNIHYVKFKKLENVKKISIIETIITKHFKMLLKYAYNVELIILPHINKKIIKMLCKLKKLKKVLIENPKNVNSNILQKCLAQLKKKRIYYEYNSLSLITVL